MIKYGDPYSYRNITLLSETSSVEKTLSVLKALSCNRNSDFLLELFNLIYNRTYTAIVPDILQACAQNNIGKKLILELLYEDLPRVIKHTSIQNLLLVFEEVSTEFEYRMVFTSDRNRISLAN